MVEHRGSGCGQWCAIAARLRAQVVGVDAGLGQLQRVADQPTLELAGIQFRMALQGQRVLTDSKGLVAAGRRAGQAACIGWKLERLAVPVQYRNALQCLQRRALALIGEQQGRETDLLAATGATLAPSARAISCAPRQMPSVGRCCCNRAFNSAMLSLRNG